MRRLVTSRLIWICTVCKRSLYRAAVHMSPEKQLIKNLLADYEERGRNGRPVTGDNETLTVHYGLSLIQILDLDERNQVLTTNVWATYGWQDVYLTWNPADYGNITKVRVPKETVWQPDVKLYNYADERLEEKRDALIVIQYDGQIVWIPQAIFKSSCSIDIRHFPFDAQTCIMKFGSWTYDGSKIELELLYEMESGFEFSDYVPSNEWTIIKSSAKKNVIKYACCPGEPFIDLTFELQIRRQPAFYNYILILPCILLSSLTLVLFWLPPESPAKMQLGMNIFVAFFVLLLLLAESTPPASSSIPLIGAYYCLNMVMITLSTFLSVVVVNIYFHTAKSEVPYIVRMIMIDVFARVFCMRYKDDEHCERKKHSKLPKLMTNDRVYGEPTHDRAMYTEVCTDETWTSSNGKGVKPTDHGSTQLPGCDITTTNACHANANIERDIKEIKTCMHKLMNKMKQKEMGEKIMREWKLVAVVLDRIFFLTYVLVITVSILHVFDFVLFKHAD